MMSLAEIGNIPIDTAVLKSLFPNHKSVHNKISTLEKTGKLIRLKKGMYVVSPRESGKLLSLELIANHLYGPSYVSMESALRFYGLIPESIASLQSMTTKHTRDFTNILGTFVYTQCSKEYFSIGIRQEVRENNASLIACPEKALCDLIIHTPNLNLRFQRELRTYLEEDLRFDMNALHQMNPMRVEQCLTVGKKKTMLTNLLKIMQS